MNNVILTGVIEVQEQASRAQLGRRFVYSSIERYEILEKCDFGKNYWLARSEFPRLADSVRGLIQAPARTCLYRRPPVPSSQPLHLITSEQDHGKTRLRLQISARTMHRITDEVHELPHLLIHDR